MSWGTGGDAGLAAWTYDATGQATTERRTISGITKSTVYEYNENGSPKKLTYWLSFWGYFFLRSTPAPRINEWERPYPVYEVLGRGFMYVVPGFEVRDVSSTPIMKAVVWPNLPCWLITWPLVQVMGTTKLLGTNAAGLRLILITMLSYWQWYFVAEVIERVHGSSRRNSRPALSRKHV